ncbi:probable aspartic protease At2g35615 [Macadamia integrifolia]|uniref:probable aspartic protease At2g35615 n=1 Tax=Macadamia integrifolia TaxID=60698 RepID=UPI001C4EC5CF|nr:probable aspartic protease At2g35615 [Macadamia integrifolia]
MTTAVLVYELFIFLSFTIFISSPCLTIDSITATNPKHPRFAVDFIHHDSPLSPFYNPNTTFWDKAARLYESSIARHAYISSKRVDKYRTDLILDHYWYLAKVTIGEPMVDVFTVFDTGSHLLWIQCRPCQHCMPQISNIYDRTKSRTYDTLTCGLDDCELAPGMGCDSNNRCTYNISYVDKSYSHGYLAKEILSFKDSEGDVMDTVRDVTFGCGFNNHITVGDLFDGILGLAEIDLSLLSQLRSITKPKFSYCMGNISDPSSKGNLIMGEDSHISGFSTPFNNDDGYYRIKIAVIKVGSLSLDIPRGAFNPYGNVILDSGTVYTFLPPEVHDLILTAISKAMERFEVQPIPPRQIGELCYKGSIGEDLNGFPTMTIRFKGNAELVLERWSIFIQVDYSNFCLAFLPTDGRNEPSMIGTMAQQFYNFGFDLDGKQLSIIRSVCIY